jgi:hypothetical protein
MSKLNRRDRVSKRHPCPICGNEGWCLRPVDTPELTICMRTQSRYNAKGGGWLHWADDGEPKTRRARRPRAKPKPIDPPLPGWRELCEGCRALIASNRLGELAKQLGVTDIALDCLGFGWSDLRHAYTCPMFSADEITIGVQLRIPPGDKSGRPPKYCMTGSCLGLFIPINLLGARYTDNGEPLLICEGASDVAYALDLGFQAIGRPAALAGGDLVVGWLGAHPRRSIAILSDMDPVGRNGSPAPGPRGARTLAIAIRPICRELRLIAPFHGSDLRSWAPSADMLRAILVNASTLK